MVQCLKMKPCKKCNEVKAFTHFYRNKKMSDGRDSYCIKCRREYTKEVRPTIDKEAKRTEDSKNAWHNTLRLLA